MIGESSSNAVDTSGACEQQLWQAVIARAIEEWLHGSGRRKDAAEYYLFSNDRDFFAVCRSAGMNPEYLRTRLTKLQGQAARENHAAAA
jgi:hypothetical protein